MIRYEQKYEQKYDRTDYIENGHIIVTNFMIQVLKQAGIILKVCDDPIERKVYLRAYAITVDDVQAVDEKDGVDE